MWLLLPRKLAVRQASLPHCSLALTAGALMRTRSHALSRQQPAKVACVSRLGHLSLPEPILLQSGSGLVWGKGE